MSVKDWYREYLSRKEQEKQNSKGFRGFSNPQNREINQMIYDSYINQGANDAEKIRSSQNTGASISDTANNIVEGFAKGGLVGAVAAAAQAKEKAKENARKNAQAIGQQTMQNAENQTRAMMNDLDTPNTLQTYNPDNYNIGQLTGGAAPATQGNINAQVYQNYLNNNPIQADNIPQEEVKNGLLNKFVNGITDFSRGYQENRNNGFNPNNLLADKFTETITTPANTQKITDYQNELANNTAYNDWANRAGVDKAEAIKAIAEGKNSGNADVDKWIKENPDAYKETTTTKTYDKGKMGKVGEFVGSVARVAQNPLVQGALVAAAGAAMGNPFALASGYKFAKDRAMSNIYENALKNYGIDIPNAGLFGNYDSRDFNALIAPQYKQVMADLAKAKLLEQQNYHNQMIENQKQLNGIRQQNADTNKQKAENIKNKPPKGNSGGGGKNGKKYELKNINNKTYIFDNTTGKLQQVEGGKSNSAVDNALSNNKANNTKENANDIINNALKKDKNKKNDKGWAF